MTIYEAATQKVKVAGLLTSAHLVAVRSGLLHYADGATCQPAGPAYQTLAGIADSAKCLRFCGADPTDLLSDEDLLAELNTLGTQIVARWNR